MRKEAISLIVVVLVIVIAVGAYIATLPPTPTTTPTTTPTMTSTTTPTTTPTEKLKVAVIYVSPIEGETWNFALNSAILKAVEKYGITYDYTEAVAPPDAPRIALTYIEQGYKLIFFHSWFPDAIKMIGADHPEVVALGGGGGTELAVLYPPPEEIPPNIGHYDQHLHEGAYLAGLLAGNLTKTNKIGLVGGFPTPQANRYFNGFIQGIKEVNENAQAKITWIYSWSDPPKAKEAAKALIEWGADFIGSDRLPGPEKATEEAKDVYVVQFNGNTPSLAPNTLICGVPWILDSAVDSIISSVIDGKFVSKEYVYTMADGGCDFIIDLPDKVPANLTTYIQAVKQLIIEGKLVITPNTNIPEQVWGI